MNTKEQSLQELQTIRRMMEQSSRFISLSGLSGIAAGLCALGGGLAARTYLYSDGRAAYEDLPRNGEFVNTISHEVTLGEGSFLRLMLQSPMFQIACITFIAALVSAFFFTWVKSRKQGIPLWGHASKRLFINLGIPLAAGAIFIYKLMELGHFAMVAPGCLLFYGLALLHAAKYTLTEIRYLALAQILLALVNCWFLGYGLYFWMAGFGICHIIYGAAMWFKYERNGLNNA
jgi:hypothetical protein